jgi:hypothetical protein
MKKLLFSLLLSATACYEPPQTDVRPEVRVVYVYVDRRDCEYGLIPSYMRCDWAFHGRNRYNVVPMRIYRPEPRRGTPPVRPEGARIDRNRPDHPVQNPKPPLDK